MENSWLDYDKITCIKYYCNIVDDYMKRGTVRVVEKG